MNNKKAADVPVDTLMVAGMKNIHKELFQLHLGTKGKTK